MKFLIAAISLFLFAGSPASASQIYQWKAKHGKPTIFHHASEVRRDCSVLSIPKITVTIQPSHGRVKVIRAKLYPDGFPANNPRYKCRYGLVKGVQAVYTSEPSFRGTDTVGIRIEFHYGNGEVRRTHYVHVKTKIKVR